MTCHNPSSPSPLLQRLPVRGLSLHVQSLDGGEGVEGTPRHRVRRHLRPAESLAHSHTRGRSKVPPSPIPWAGGLCGRGLPVQAPVPAAVPAPPPQPLSQPQPQAPSQSQSLPQGSISANTPHGLTSTTIATGYTTPTAARHTTEQRHELVRYASADNQGWSPDGGEVVHWRMALIGNCSKGGVRMSPFFKPHPQGGGGALLSGYYEGRR